MHMTTQPRIAYDDLGEKEPAVVLLALSRMETPCPTLHLYAQPTDPEFFHAQLGFGRQNLGSKVERLDAKSHFPMYERPGDMIEAIDTFATRLAP